MALTNRFQLGLVLFNVMLYAACYQMQTPVQPYLVKSLSADSVSAFGLLKSWNGLLQLFGSLLVGRWIDAQGPRPVLVGSFAASALIYALTYYADSVAWLIAAQIPTVLQHAVLAARGYVALHTPEDKRTQTLGYISVAYGAGFVVGPSLGGYLAQHHSLRASAAAATVGSVASLLSLLAFLENDHHSHGSSGGSKKTAAAAEKTQQSSSSPTNNNNYGRVWSDGTLAGLLTVKALASGALAMFHSTFTLVAADRFGMGAKDVGALMSFVGALGIVTQAALVDPLVRRFSEGAISTVSALLLALSFVGHSAASSAVELYAVCVPLTLLNTIFMLLNTSAITRASPPDLKGTLVAADMALGSGSRMLAPAAGAYLLHSVGYWSMGATSAALMGGATLLLAMGVGAGGPAAPPSQQQGKANEKGAKAE